MPRAKTTKKAMPADVFDDTPAAEKPKAGIANADRLAALAKVSGKFKGHRPVRDVLRVVRAVPTIFPWFDWITRVGGFPTDRIALVHGPSSHGKTVFTHGLGKSFLQRGHFYRFMDAERTSPITWLEKLWGKDFVDHPGFSACRPTTYEDAVDDVRRWCSTIAEAREKKEIPTDTTGLIVVDSIRKLVPQGFFDKVRKAAGLSGDKDVADEIGIDGYGGRGAQIKAMLNAAWMDELVPLMDDTRCAIAIITRESEEANPNPRGAPIIKTKGGNALIFESSLVMRVRRSKWVKEDKNAVDSAVFGEQHEVGISKTKVAGKDDRIIKSFFSTSNGTMPESPEGFARAWDVFDLAVRLDVVKKSGSWYMWNGNRWQGDMQAYRKLSANPELTDRLEAACRENFKLEAPEEVDSDGVVTSPHTDGAL